jgi:hypothetical protein
MTTMDRASRERLRQHLLKERNAWQLLDIAAYGRWRDATLRDGADTLKTLLKERVRALKRNNDSSGSSTTASLTTLLSSVAPSLTTAEPSADSSSPAVGKKTAVSKSVSSRGNKRLVAMTTSSSSGSSLVPPTTTDAPPSMPESASPDVVPDMNDNSNGSINSSSSVNSSLVRPLSDKALLDAALLLGFNEREHFLDPNDFAYASNAHQVELLQCHPRAFAQDAMVNDLARFCLPRGIELSRTPVAPTFSPFVLTNMLGDRQFCVCVRFFERAAVRGLRSAAPAHRRQLRVAVAKFDFRGSKPTELSFKAGDQIVLQSTANADWWLGHKLREPLVGFFPAAFVTTAAATSAEPPLPTVDGGLSAVDAESSADGAFFVAKCLVLVSRHALFATMRRVCEVLVDALVNASTAPQHFGVVLAHLFDDVRLPVRSSRVRVAAQSVGPIDRRRSATARQ